MSTFSPSLRIELITTGDQAGVWGNTTNTNLGTLVESAIAGYVSVSITSANQALTAVNGAADQSRSQVSALTTTTVAAQPSHCADHNHRGSIQRLRSARGEDLHRLQRQRLRRHAVQLDCTRQHHGSWSGRNHPRRQDRHALV